MDVRRQEGGKLDGRSSLGALLALREFPHLDGEMCGLAVSSEGHLITPDKGKQPPDS